MNKERRKTIAQPDLFPDRPSRVSGAAYQEPVQKMHEFNFWDLATMESRPDWIMLEGLDLTPVPFPGRFPPETKG